MKSLIKVNNLEKKFLSSRLRDVFKNKVTTVALKNISFSLENGNILGILGPNGAGKTTLLKIISTLILPDKGYAEINGYKVGENDIKIKSLIGLVTSDERNFYWRLSGWQNLEFFSDLYEINKKTFLKKTRELFSLFKIDSPDERFDSYSTGTKRKFSLIRALLHDPEILLLDEPTKSLDYDTSLELHNIIRKISEKGKTIIIATHDMNEAKNICNKFLFLNRGQIKGFGSLNELKNKAKLNSDNLENIYIALTKDV